LNYQNFLEKFFKFFFGADFLKNPNQLTIRLTY
jgi:hypothetical protein